MKKTNQSRRDFLTRCAMLSAAGFSTPLASLGALSLPTFAASPPAEFRAMVCIYLVGGNDLNMLVPNDDSNFALYRDLRTSIALARNTLLPITSTTNNVESQFGLHPRCTGMQELYNAGNLAFVTNTGALIEPTTVAQFKAKSVRLPPAIRSHNTQKDFVQAGLPYAGERINGWAGRIADMYKAAGSTAQLNLNYAGDNMWQRGASTTTYNLFGSGVRTLFDHQGSRGQARKESLRAINELNNGHLLTDEYGRLMQKSLDLSDSIRTNIGMGAIELQTQFPTTSTSQTFKNIANVINARAALQMPQQTFYMSIGGWDHHNSLLANHASALENLSEGLKAFYSALEEMGVQNQVTAFTNHDFGRTLRSNGDGSDHAWGGHQIVMGGAVNGGQVYGNLPVFSPDDPQYSEFASMLVPTTSTDQLSATIAKWFGDFTESQLVDLFPNLANFNTKTLGFL